MEQENLYKSAETRQCKMVFPGTLNANETLFGGEVMKWMDEVAFITATRFTRQRMFTAKVKNVDFICPIRENSIVEIVGTIENVGMAKLEVKVELFCESLYECGPYSGVKALFVMTALDNENNITRLAVPNNVTRSEN